MAVTVTQVRLLGPDLRCYDVTYDTTDTTTDEQEHGLPFTPTFSAVVQMDATGDYPALALAVTATTWTLSKQVTQTAGSARVFVGRMSNPQNHR